MGRLLVLPTSRAGWGLLIAFVALVLAGAGDWFSEPGHLGDGLAADSCVELPGNFCLRGGDADRQPHCGARRP